jgi:hypothetical protein
LFPRKWRSLRLSMQYNESKLTIDSQNKTKTASESMRIFTKKTTKPEISFRKLFTTKMTKNNEKCLLNVRCSGWAKSSKRKEILVNVDIVDGSFQWIKNVHKQNKKA